MMSSLKYLLCDDFVFGPFLSIQNIDNNTLLCDGIRIDTSDYEEVETSPFVYDVPSFESLRQKCLSDLGKAYQKHFYTNVDVEVDEIPITIQFRNETDRFNLTNVIQTAQVLSNTNVNATVNFRAEDNVVYAINCVDFINLGVLIFSEKQTILNQYWDAKDIIVSLPVTMESFTYLNTFDPEFAFITN